MALQVVILAAGMGTRLGKPWPKPLTPLADGRSIMQQQLENVEKVFGDRLFVQLKCWQYKLHLCVSDNK